MRVGRAVLNRVHGGGFSEEVTSELTSSGWALQAAGRADAEAPRKEELGL